ncbi:hypothetical protein ABT084_32175 [Streptomyces sp. NPDC002138]|uniref:hypothetical protein n=1 Tax=Streptomyces sp. NPDC002138 TaxID=3154410 RepID=UPI00331C5647
MEDIGLTLGVTLYTGLGPAALWFLSLTAGRVAAAGTATLRRRVTARLSHTLAA